MFRFNTNVLKKNINISVKPLNKALDRSIKDRDLSNKDVAQNLGMYTPAAIGNYRKGRRDVPTDLVIKWKEHYGEDLMAAPETDVSTNKTNVSRETNTEENNDPWRTITRLTEAFVLNSQMHKDEVSDLRNDKNDFKNELLEMVRFLRTNSAAYKTK